MAEGTLMRSAVVDGLLEASVAVSLLRDPRLVAAAMPACEELVVTSAAKERTAFEAACERADAVLVIAPEFDSLLIERVRWAEAGAARLISPGSDSVAIAGDKWKTYQSWLRAGVPTPPTWLAKDFTRADDGERYVCKPRDGAGSQDIDFLESAEKLAERPGAIVQTFCDGLPVSAGVLSDGNQFVLLPPAIQLIDSCNGFQYRGGSWSLSEELKSRAQALARRCAAGLPPFRGYIGVDMILNAKDGGDFAIEINPRLTTSYFGLRQLCRGNLSAAMLSFALGEPIEIEFSSEAYQFKL
ncbi:hypothetical protein DSM3645_24792 [Blastopirellula marina DSM 3645]|uniref:ATP-grasp domain-containing protein n=1 Tax=Blastopirellula marina DSM 3645 TaxID=314230 RepID=A4A0U5_9BACT|nr:hypothetical protein DSM3645_24792 [Blastopirellula marina DSM 3645]